MRIRSVTAHAFGPLAGETLTLADGLTVVYGPNESAKSTWHAALYAALCGRRRGAADKEEQAFEKRHRPWDRPDHWEVGAEVLLADGRRVELRHDLAGRVACYAKDLDRVADYSKEITSSSRGEVPDASRWLGLDRRAFLAVACVRQSELLAVTREANGIRDYVQRAAATAGADATAAAALAAVTNFHETRVGTARSHKRPLQLAEKADQVARAALADARHAHQRLDEVTAHARELRTVAAGLQERLDGAEAAQASASAGRLQAEADRLRRRAMEADELTGLLATPAAQDPSSAAIATAIAAWEQLALEPSIKSTVDAAARRPAASRSRSSTPVPVIVAVLLIVAGVAALITGATTIAVAALAAGVLAGALVAYQVGRATAQGEAAAVDAGRAADVDAWRALRDRAAGQVQAAATSIGISTVEPTVAVPALSAWLADEPARAARREERAAWRARLADLLDGASAAELRERADSLAQQATQVLDGLPAVISPPAAGGDAGLRQKHADADRQAYLAEKQVAELAAAQVPVAEAEERAAAASAELTRLRELDQILAITRQFLAQAEQRVNKDMAPRLAGALRHDLAAVTGGRYVDAVVDAQTLRVQVRGEAGRLRDADQLSVGTAEQIYLLLRVALAEHLVKPGESCPLLLDDVTVNADAARTEQILQLLTTVARRHQVVVFTQQQQVRDWARRHARGDRDAVRELPPIATV